MSTRIFRICLLSLLAVGCGDLTVSEPPAETNVAAAPAEPTEPAHAEPAVPAPTPTAAPAAPATNAPAAGETITLEALQSGFETDRDAWMGREVTVTALYFSSSSVGGELNNIALKSSRESGANTMCAFSTETRPNPEPSLTQFAPVTVTGTVGQFFGFPKIDNCRIVRQ